MRINHLFFILLLSSSLFFVTIKLANAGTCTSCSNICGDCMSCGGQEVCTTTAGQTCVDDPSNPYDRCIEGYPNTTCITTGASQCTGSCCVHNLCEDFPCCNTAQGDYCGPTNPNPTNPPGDPGNPTNPPTTTPTVVPTSTGAISGTLQRDAGAALSGAFCTQASSLPLSLTGITAAANKDGFQYPATFSGANFSIITYTGSNHSVLLDLSTQTNATRYVCSCPAAIDPTNPFLCRYTGVNSPTANVNFYLQEYNLSNVSWFQVFGGNLFSQNNISTRVPYDFCVTDVNCKAALLAPQLPTNPRSSGFAITGVSTTDSIKTSDIAANYHSYLHLSDRPNNLNAYATQGDLAPISYDYFYKLAENSMHQFSNGEDYEPLITDFTVNSWWSNTEINYVNINGNVNIDESQGFHLTGSQKLVVFVDGNLILDDSNPNDTNRKITSVPSGGFLAFFVSGNIIITPDVGYELNPNIPTVPAVSVANSNLEGVFVATGTLTVQNKSAVGEAPPDKKFIGAGTFVGWSGINLNRTFDDLNRGPVLNNNQAIENFLYRPDLLVNWPTKLKASVSNWREIDPQLIAQ